MLSHLFNKVSKGLTLAELLITLFIIGVIASETIPSLLINYKNKIYITQWKKSFSTLNSLAKMIEVDNGTLPELHTSSIAILFLDYLNKVKTGSSQYSYYLPDGTDITNTTYMRSFLNMYSASNYLIYLADGSIITPSTNNGNKNCEIKNGLSVCYFVTVDVNGEKGPNIVGTDIFMAYIVEGRGAIPAGSPMLGQTPSCAGEDYTAVYCSAQRLLE